MGGVHRSQREEEQKNTCTTSGRRFREITLSSVPCCFSIRFGTDILRSRQHEARRQEKEEDKAEEDDKKDKGFCPHTREEEEGEEEEEEEDEEAEEGPGRRSEDKK